MRRRDHERIVHEKDRTIARLERQNEQLLDRLMYVGGQPWGLPEQPPSTEDEPLPDYAFSPEDTIDALPEVG